MGHMADKVVAKVDCTNAFAAVRTAILCEVWGHLPELAAWANSCNANSGLQSATVTLEADVHQGDHLGPPLYAHAPQPALRRLADTRPRFSR